MSVNVKIDSARIDSSSLSAVEEKSTSELSAADEKSQEIFFQTAIEGVRLRDCKRTGPGQLERKLRNFEEAEQAMFEKMMGSLERIEAMVLEVKKKKENIA
ncbi:MAG: hypothetical protein JSS09_01090 [Verrucomicrobia bacterium]|nr:hypothetical protein [Verrucomicrobiota bacterium]